MAYKFQMRLPCSVTALRYEGEENFRYPAASDPTWRTEDTVRAYSLRRLIGVLIRDRKPYEGWDTLTGQRGDEGSERTPILSLPTDHCLLLHPGQRQRMSNRLPAITVGCLFLFIRELMSDGDKNRPDEPGDTVSRLFRMSPSEKHTEGRDPGNPAPSPSSKYKAAWISESRI